MLRIGLSIVQRFEDQLLAMHGEFDKGLSEIVACAISSIAFDPKPVCLLVGRHVFIAKAIERILVQPLVDDRENGNGACLRTIVLRHHTVDRPRLSNAASSAGKKANRRNLLDALCDDIARRLVPALLLVHGAVAGVVARLLEISELAAG